MRYFATISIFMASLAVLLIGTLYLLHVGPNSSEPVLVNRGLQLEW